MSKIITRSIAIVALTFAVAMPVAAEPITLEWGGFDAVTNFFSGLFDVVFDAATDGDPTPAQEGTPAAPESTCDPDGEPGACTEMGPVVEPN